MLTEVSICTIRLSAKVDKFSGENLQCVEKCHADVGQCLLGGPWNKFRVILLWWHGQLRKSLKIDSIVSEKFIIFEVAKWQTQCMFWKKIRTGKAEEVRSSS